MHFFWLVLISKVWTLAPIGPCTAESPKIFSFMAKNTTASKWHTFEDWQKPLITFHCNGFLTRTPNLRSLRLIPREEFVQPLQMDKNNPTHISHLIQHDRLPFGFRSLLQTINIHPLSTQALKQTILVCDARNIKLPFVEGKQYGILQYCSGLAMEINSLGL